ncbi:MAG: hypothetical protein RIT28_1864 [Pseudomonadota bacterium]
MSAPTTLTAALEQAAEGAEGAEGGFRHLRDDGAARRVSFAELYAQARRVAAALQGAGLRQGDRAALILPDAVEFIDTFFGCMVAGVIPVPMYPPMNLAQLKVWLSGCGHTLRQAGCRAVITDAQVRPLLGTLLAETPSLSRVETLASLLAEVGPEASPRAVRVQADDVAFLQFTSGSTARPKGVTLTHQNLIANTTAIGAGLGLTRHDARTGVSWLPLYHDMGLIGCVFTPVVHGLAQVTLIPPLQFLKRPSIWLRQVSETRASFTFAPNFAYGLASARVKDHELEGLELSCLDVAGCGAEPIQAQTLHRFADRYAPLGFRRRAFLPCYGLAEHSLAVTFVGVDDELRVDRLDPAALAEGVARPAEGEVTLDVVSCGRPFLGHAVRITDPAGEVAPEGQVGQIELAGPSVMRGYWDDPERTDAALRDGWLRTGDLGYLRDGELFVTGRLKDLIIQNGKNYYPTDLEWQASQVDGVRRGNVVAFGIYDAALGRERVVLVVETRAMDRAEALRAEITAGILERLSLRVDEVVLLAPGGLPKTSSGKLQRARAAELYTQGALGQPGVSTLGLGVQLLASRWGYLKAGLRRMNTTPGDADV